MREVERGARVDKLWHASALGMLDRLDELLRDPANSTQDAIDQAFWHGPAAGKRRVAEFFLAHRADLALTPAYGRGTVLDAARIHGTQRSNVFGWREQLGVRPAN